MFEFLNDYKGLTRRDLIAHVLRSCIAAPVIGAVPGVLFGSLIFGPVEGKPGMEIWIGAMLGAVFGTMSGAFLGFPAVRAPFVKWAALVLAGACAPLLFMSLGPTEMLAGEWSMGLLVAAWAGLLMFAGYRWGRPAPEHSAVQNVGPVTRLD